MVYIRKCRLHPQSKLVLVLLLVLPSACGEDETPLPSCFEGDCCTSAADCLNGYRCADTGYCELNSTACSDDDSDGTSEGSGCPEGIPTDCDDGDPLVRPGVEEECNGRDDDCDGDIDEDLPAMLCPLQAGVCQGATTVCEDGVWAECEESSRYSADYQNVPEAEEACDGLDNNCSGGEVDRDCPN